MELLLPGGGIIESVAEGNKVPPLCISSVLVEEGGGEVPREEEDSLLLKSSQTLPFRLSPSAVPIIPIVVGIIMS